MNCTQINNKLIFFIDDSLSEEESAILSAHLKECKECLSSYNFIKEIYSQIENEKVVEPDPYFFTRLEQKIENIHTSRRLIRSWLRPQPILRTIGYSILIVLGIMSGILFGNFASDVILMSPNTSGIYESDLSINEMYDEVIELSFYYE